MQYDVDQLLSGNLWLELAENSPPIMRDRWMEVRNRMIVHTQGLPSEKLIGRQRPYEDESIARYRLDNYTPITQPIISRAFNALTRIFQDDNHAIMSWSDDLAEYMAENRFYGRDLRLFLYQVVMKSMIEDPNGLLIWVPDEESMLSSRPQTRIDVLPEIITSDRILFWHRDLLVVESEEKTWIKRARNSKTTVPEGQVVYVINRDKIAKCKQIGEKHEKKYEITYEHNLPEGMGLPVITLGGDYVSEGYYDSYFSAFSKFGDEAIRQFSDWQAIMVTSAFPIKVMDSMECDNPNAFYDRQGRHCIGDPDNIDTHRKCPRCNGEGKIYGFGPYGVIVKPDQSNTPPGEQYHDPEMLRYVSPDVNIIRESRESWMVLLDKAEQSLNLNFILEAQSGVAKAIDREELYSMLNNISSNFYDNIMFRSMWLIEQYRHVYPNDRVKPVIIKPKEFHIRTERELLDEYKELIQNNTTKALADQALTAYIDKAYSGDKVTKKTYEFLLRYDVLLSYNVAEKTTVADVFGDKGENMIIRNIYARQALQALAAEVDQQTFVEMEYPQMKAWVDAYIQPYLVPETQPLQFNDND